MIGGCVKFEREWVCDFRGRGGGRGEGRGGDNLLAFPVKQTLVLVVQLTVEVLRQIPTTPKVHLLQVRDSTETHKWEPKELKSECTGNKTVFRADLHNISL